MFDELLLNLLANTTQDRPRRILDFFKRAEVLVARPNRSREKFVRAPAATTR